MGTPHACGASLSTQCHRNAVPCYDDSLHWPWAGKTLNWCRIVRGMPCCVHASDTVDTDRSTIYAFACYHPALHATIWHCMRLPSTTCDHTEVHASIRHCMQSHDTGCNHQHYMRSPSTTCDQSELHAITWQCMRSPSTTCDHSALHAITRHVIRSSYYGRVHYKLLYI